MQTSVPQRPCEGPPTLSKLIVVESVVQSTATDGLLHQKLRNFARVFGVCVTYLYFSLKRRQSNNVAKALSLAKFIISVGSQKYSVFECPTKL